MSDPRNPRLVRSERASIAAMIAAWTEPDGVIIDDSPRRIAMSALDPATATALDVQSALESSHLCLPTECSQCDRATWELVEIGAEPDYESQTAWLCRACLVAALAVLDAAYPPR